MLLGIISDNIGMLLALLYSITLNGANKMSDTILETLIVMASARHGAITPCTKCKTFAESTSIEMGYFILWYNDKSGSTHIAKIKINNN